MKILIAGLAAASVAASLLATPIEARAGDGGAVAAGIIGGLAAGALIGSAASRPVVVAPAPVYAVPPPPPPTCYWAPGAAVWDPYRAAWVRPQVQVCN
jgi:hypothetical protein